MFAAERQRGTAGRRSNLISRIHNNCFCVDSKTHFVDLGEHFFTRTVETDIKLVLAFPTLNCRLGRYPLFPVLLICNQRQRSARPRPKCGQSSPKINVPQSRKAPPAKSGRNDSAHASSSSPILAICDADRPWRLKFLNVLLYHSTRTKIGSSGSNSFLPHA